MSLIGWDDTFSRDNFAVVPPGDGAWLVKNSWGAAFGDAGCFWISYYDTPLDNAVFYDVVPSNAYDHNYQYDGGILPTSMPVTAVADDAGITVSSANVFVSEGWEGCLRCRFSRSIKMCLIRCLFQQGIRSLKIR